MSAEAVAAVDTTELDKMSEVTETSQSIGEFIDWLQYDQGLQLAKYGTTTEYVSCSGAGGHDCYGGKAGGQYWDTEAETWRLGPYPESDKRHGTVCGRCKGEGTISIETDGWITDSRSIEQLLADYFGIDRDKVEVERRALLEAMRA